MDKKIQSQKISMRIGSQLLKDIGKVKGKSRSDKIKRILKAGLSNQTIDNSDYSDILNAIFDLKTEIAPVGANLNQLARYFNQGNEAENITNISMLDELEPQFKQLMKILKYIQREIIIK